MLVSTIASPWAISIRCATGATPVTRVLLVAPPGVSDLLCGLNGIGRQAIDGYGLPLPRGDSAGTAHLGKIEKIMGGALIVFGVLIATNALLYIGEWMINEFAVFQTIG
mgnify:CR=1 FL=1